MAFCLLRQTPFFTNRFLSVFNTTFSLFTIKTFKALNQIFLLDYKHKFSTLGVHRLSHVVEMCPLVYNKTMIM